MSKVSFVPWGGTLNTDEMQSTQSDENVYGGDKFDLQLELDVLYGVHERTEFCQRVLMVLVRFSE